MGVFSAGVPGMGVDAPDIVCLAELRNDFKEDAIFCFVVGTVPLRGGLETEAIRQV